MARASTRASWWKSAFISGNLRDRGGVAVMGETKIERNDDFRTFAYLKVQDGFCVGAM